MSDELRVLITASSGVEAAMVREWLAEASIHSLARVSRRGIRLSAGAPREVFVYESDLERAREVLNAEMPSEEELAALRARAVSQPTRPALGEPMQIPVPERADVERAARPGGSGAAAATGALMSSVWILDRIRLAVR